MLRPLALHKIAERGLAIDWSDGHRSEFTWANLRKRCPCAGCREERLQPADPFRILKPAELGPLKPVSMNPVGYYAYKIVWNDGHDSGLFTLEYLREICECRDCLGGAGAS